MNNPPKHWLLLIVSLPTQGATARMRVWRALKALGCGSLRDGAFLLPDEATHRLRLQELCDETIREGGSGWLLTVNTQSAAESEAYQALFNRAADYAELSKTLTDARKALIGLSPQEITRILRKVRRDYEALRAIDFFPDETSTHAESAWLDFLHYAEGFLSPGEPRAVDTRITRCDAATYQGRTWTTRRHLWVDRVASAWLIHRFIDKAARFLWLASPADCPADALGFDFDGAAFTHIGDRVTFEVLLASFGLEQDAALLRLGAMVHVLDVGNGFAAEAAGFEAILSGTRQRAVDDDQLLAEFGMVLDALYTHFSLDPHTVPSKE